MKMNKGELQEICEGMNIAPSGTKSDLTEKIMLKSKQIRQTQEEYAGSVATERRQQHGQVKIVYPHHLYSSYFRNIIFSFTFTEIELRIYYMADSLLDVLTSSWTYFQN